MLAFDGPKNVEVTEKAVRELLETFKRIGAEVNPHDGVGFALERTLKYARGLFQEHPFRVGDIVELVDPPDVVGTGWSGASHLFVKGTRCEVCWLDWDETGFLVGIMFEKETCRHFLTKEEIPLDPDRRSWYGNILAKRFRKVSPA